MIIDWQVGTALAVIREQIVPHCESIAEWFDPPDMEIPVQAYIDSRERIFVVKHTIGALSFPLTQPAQITLHPHSEFPLEQFRQLVIADWLPALLPFQGLQVLHASAVQESASRQVIAFCAHSGTGKSTLAYGLGRCEGWQHFADDSLILDCDAQLVQVAPVRTEIRLRAPSAAYFALEHHNLDTGAMDAYRSPLLAIYHLTILEDTANSPVQITMLPPLQAYPLLLQHAYTLTLTFPELNQRLMRDYLCVSRSIPVYELAFHHNFAQFDLLTAAIRAHVAELVGV